MNYCEPPLPGSGGRDIEVPASRLGPDFGLQVIRDRERVIVAVSGEVDLATAGELRAAAIALLEDDRARVVFDLQAVTFLDSTGIRTLIAVHRRAVELSAGVSLIVGRGQPRRILELTGVADHLNLEPIEQETAPTSDVLPEGSKTPLSEGRD